MLNKPISFSVLLLSVISLISAHSLIRKDEAPVTLQEKIFLNAETNLDLDAWAKDSERQSKRKTNIFFDSGEWKNNLFVYEIILASGYDVGTPNQLNASKHPELAANDKLDRPPCAKDWYYNYETKVSGAVLVGEGSDGINEAIPGDVITDGINIGIYYGDGEIVVADPKVISKTKSWGSNGFGFDNIPVKIFRIDPSIQRIDTDTTSASGDLKTENANTEVCDLCYCDTKYDRYLSGEAPVSTPAPATNNTDTTNTESSGVDKLLHFSVINVFIMLMTILFW